MTEHTAANIAIHALLDLDTEGEVAEQLTGLLTGAREGSWSSEGHEESLRLLLPAITADERAQLCVSLDLCPVHERDIDICADDEDPECAEKRAELLAVDGDEAEEL